MRKPKFTVGDLVTRGRGKVTLRVTAVRTGEAGGPCYDLVDTADFRARPRPITGVAESNIRSIKEPDNG